MIASVSARSVCGDGAGPTDASGWAVPDRYGAVSTGDPTATVTSVRGSSRNRLWYQSTASCDPHWATGTTGASGTSRASRATPVLATIGQ